MRPIYTAIALRCRWNCTKNSINFLICSCNTSTYIVQKVRFEAFMWINHERLSKEALDSVNIWLSDSCTSVRFKAIWGEIAWVSFIYLWDGTVPRHDDALSVFTSFLMDLWDGKHGNLSQVWELFFYLIKLVSWRFLCAIDPSNGSAAPCCAKVHNKYLLCSLHVKVCLRFYF